MTVTDDIRLAIVRIVSGVPNAGNIYPHYKYSSNWRDFLGQFSFTDENGLPIYRGGWISIPTVRQGPESTFDSVTDVYTWVIRLVSSLSDKYNSEERFETLIYLIRKTLYQHTTLGLSSTEIIPGTVEVRIPTVDIRRFGSPLVHYAELVLTVEANVTDAVYTP